MREMEGIMLCKEIDVTEPFNAIKKMYPDGTIFLKKLKFTGYKVKKGWERVTDEEKLQHKTQGVKKETYGSVVSDYRAEQAHRLREVQRKLDNVTDDVINIVYEPLEVAFDNDNDNEDKDEEKKRKKVLYNIAKTRNKIFDIARSNEFNCFITLTYSAEKCNRYSFTECSKKVRRFMNNFGVRHKEDCPDFKYLLVHEQHKDGAYHYHGLIYLENEDLLKYDEVRSRQYANKHHGEKLDIYNWSNWKNGFSTVSKIENQDACRKYILKYVSKNIDEDYQKGQRHFYYSQNCLKPEVESLISDEQMLYLYDQIYDTERSTGYESTVENINEMLSTVIEYQYGIEV